MSSDMLHSVEVFDFKHTVPRQKAERVTELWAVCSALCCLLWHQCSGVYLLPGSMQLCWGTWTCLQALKGRRAEAECLLYIRHGDRSFFSSNKEVVPLIEGYAVSWPRGVVAQHCWKYNYKLGMSLDNSCGIQRKFTVLALKREKLKLVFSVFPCFITEDLVLLLFVCFC